MSNKITVPTGNLKAQVMVWSAVTGRHQYELAGELGISKSMLSQILSGRKPGADHLERIEALTQIA